MRRADVTTQAGDDLFRHGGVGGGGVGGEAAIEIAGRLGARREEIFTYDTLNRLESATVSDTLNLTQLGQATANYDALGNLTFKSDVGGYVYGAAGAGPHAVTQAGDTTYGYDEKGSMTSATVTLTGAVLRGVTWSSFGKPTRIEEADGALASEFVYGPDRARIKQTSYVGAAPTKTIIYAGGGFERHITPGAPDELVHYIGGAVAVFTKTDDANPATDKTRWLHKDHLGSVVMVTDEAGLVAETRSYDAWGGLRNPDWTVPAVTPFLTETARGFTGHEHLQAVGLIHMNGRVYDPKLGRMLSADPFVQAPAFTQSFNRYSYVFNNPLSFTDPSGFCTAEGGGGGCDQHTHEPDGGGGWGCCDISRDDSSSESQNRGDGLGDRNYDGGGLGDGTGSGLGNAAAFNGSALNGAATGGFGVGGYAVGGVFAPGLGFGSLLSTTSTAGGLNLAGGAFMDAFKDLLSKSVALTIDVIGKVWNSPNTAIGLVWGGLGYVAGLVMGTDPGVSIGNGAIQFTNNPLTATAMAFGNVTIYSPHKNMQPWSPRPSTSSGATHAKGGVTLGDREKQHGTGQGQVLGPSYFPAHIVFGLRALIVDGYWHGPANILETGPHNTGDPRPWP